MQISISILVHFISHPTNLCSINKGHDVLLVFVISVKDKIFHYQQMRIKAPALLNIKFVKERERFIYP